MGWMAVVALGILVIAVIHSASKPGSHWVRNSGSDSGRLWMSDGGGDCECGPDGGDAGCDGGGDCGDSD